LPVNHSSSTSTAAAPFAAKELPAAVSALCSCCSIYLLLLLLLLLWNLLCLFSCLLTTQEADVNSSACGQCCVHAHPASRAAATTAWSRIIFFL
jgi:hypothetical protein